MGRRGRTLTPVGPVRPKRCNARLGARRARSIVPTDTSPNTISAQPASWSADGASASSTAPRITEPIGWIVRIIDVIAAGVAAATR